MTYRKCAKCECALSLNVDFTFCGGLCKDVYCAKCTKLSRSEYKIISENENISWNCDTCTKQNPTKKLIDTLEFINQQKANKKSEIDQMKNLTKMITEMNENQTSIQTELEHLRREVAENKKKECNERCENNKGHLYEQRHPASDTTTKTGASAKIGIICIPKKKQACVVTKNEIKEKLKNYNDMVNGLRNLNDGAVLIECDNVETAHKMRNDACKAMSEYEIKDLQRRKPKIKIVNISEEFNENELLERIKLQNNSIADTDEINIMKIIKKKPNKHNETYYTAIIETNGPLFNKFMHAGHVTIGWERCKVYECVSIQRCYKCLGFNHRATECTGEISCSKCAGNHIHTQCRSRQQNCINCVNFAKNVNFNVNTTHSAFDSECYVYKKQIDKKRNRIDYKE